MLHRVSPGSTLYHGHTNPHWHARVFHRNVSLSYSRFTSLSPPEEHCVATAARSHPPNMASQFSSTYQQYKEKTSQALEWLIASATELGLMSKTQTKHLPVLQMVGFAKSCVMAGRAMPKKHRRNLKEAIDLRRRVAERFQGLGCEESNSTHAFFIETLESILEHFTPSKILAVAVVQPQQLQKASETPEGNSGRNYFAVLRGKSRATKGAGNDEADEDKEADSKNGLPPAMDKDMFRRKKGDTDPHSNKSTGFKTQSSTDAFELWADDPLMEVSFLLEDAHEVRQHIQRLWKRYQNLEIDLITATVVTQAASQHMYLLNRELVQKYPLMADHHHLATFMAFELRLGGISYKEFCRMWREERFSADNDLCRRWAETGRLNDDETEEWLLNRTDFVLSSITTVQRLPSGTSLEEWVRSRSQSSSDCGVDRSVAKDLRHMLNAYTDAKRPPKIVTDVDYFSTILRDLSNKSTPPLHTENVFLGRIVLDLLDMEGLQQHVDADLKQYIGYCKLRDLRKMDSTDLEFYNDTGRGPKPIRHFISVLESRLSGNKPLTYNPVFLGSVLLEVISRANVHYLIGVNEAGLLLQGAHLYHGARVLDGIDRWSDMEALIALQKIQIFAGELPQTLKQCIQRRHLALGMKPSELTAERTRGDQKNIWAVHKTAHKIMESKTRGMNKRGTEYRRCRDTYFAKRNTPGRRRELFVHCFCPDTEELYNHFQQDHPGGPLSRSGSFSGIEFLSQVEKWTRARIPALFFDYAALHKILTEEWLKPVLEDAKRHAEGSKDLIVDDSAGSSTSDDIRRIATKDRISTEWREFCEYVKIPPPGIRSKC